MNFFHIILNFKVNVLRAAQKVATTGCSVEEAEAEYSVEFPSDAARDIMMRGVIIMFQTLARKRGPEKSASILDLEERTWFIVKFPEDSAVYVYVNGGKQFDEADLREFYGGRYKYELLHNYIGCNGEPAIYAFYTPAEAVDFLSDFVTFQGLDVRAKLKDFLEE